MLQADQQAARAREAELRAVEERDMWQHELRTLSGQLLEMRQEHAAAMSVLSQMIERAETAEAQLQRVTEQRDVLQEQYHTLDIKLQAEMAARLAATAEAQAHSRDVGGLLAWRVALILIPLHAPLIHFPCCSSSSVSTLHSCACQTAIHRLPRQEYERLTLELQQLRVESTISKSKIHVGRWEWQSHRPGYSI